MATDNLEEIKAKIKVVKLLILDVDGVFTNGAFYMNGSGKEYKKFCAKDGLGVGLLKAADFPIAIISGKHSEATSYRMKDLGVTEDVYQGQLNKIESYNVIKNKYKLDDSEIAYAGDDLIDLPILKRVGAPMCVPDATDEVKEASLYVTKNSGGNGAVREIIDLILKTQNKYLTAAEKLVGYKKEQ